VEDGTKSWAAGAGPTAAQAGKSILFGDGQGFAQHQAAVKIHKKQGQFPLGFGIQHFC